MSSGLVVDVMAGTVVAMLVAAALQLAQALLLAVPENEPELQPMHALLPVKPE